MIPLTIHSHFSLMQSTISCSALCSRAQQLGYSAIGLTDINNLYGLWSFLAACRKHGLRPIVGAELRTAEQRVFCLVKNGSGYRNLCRLLTDRHCSPDFSPATVPADRLQGLVLLTTDVGLLTTWREQELDVAAAIADRPTQANSFLRRTAACLDIPAAAVSDVFFLQKGQQQTRNLLRAIAHNSAISRLPAAEIVSPQAYLAPAAEYEHRFQVWPEVLKNSHALAERCTFRGPQFGLVLPPFNKKTPAEADMLLRQAALRGAQKRYGNPLPAAVTTRLEHELQIISDMGFSSYFLVVHDIVRPVARTCGRGSGAASLVAYCLRITNVCPIKYNLYFERFLNPGRRDAPDIDIDFAWDERDLVLQSLFKRFGCRAAMVCNHVTLQARMAVRETAKVFGLPACEINRVTKQISGLQHGRKDGNLLSRLRAMPRLRGFSFEKPWPDILQQAERIIGVPANLSVHPGGVIITPDPVRDYVPVQYAAKGLPIIQWEKDGAEQAGLVKIDLLGNRSLGVVRDAVAGVIENTIQFDEDQWQPEDDAKTKTLIRTGRTMGCFYIESPAMRLLQKKAGRGDFESLVLHSSIIRPAANECIREYLRRLHGGGWQPLHPLIADTLNETFGIMVYQEDVSRVAVQLGFSPAEADRLRKIMSKKDREMQLTDYRDRFFTAATDRDMAPQTAEEIWRMMMSFEGYSFCKPHSASYARVSFQAAYLKAHFPAEFMAAVLSNQGGYYSTFAYISEARRLGLRILPPDVNSSDRLWRGGKQRLRVGLMAVRNLSVDTCNRIVCRRKRKKYSSVLDFFQRIRPADDEARALIHAGALDSLARGTNIKTSRPALLYLLAHWRQTRPSVAARLFIPRPVVPRLPPEDPRQRLRNEYRALGFLCHMHPIRLFEGYRKQRQTIPARELPTFAGKQQQVRFLGWPIAGKIVGTKSGRPMEFLTFEDETDQVECTLFPQTYHRCCHLLHADGPLLLEGKVEQDFGAATLTVAHVEPVSGNSRQ